MYITTGDDLAVLCEQLKKCDVLALDTEFVRERTYFHRLGLIQVAGDGVCAAIDPILISDLSPFLEIVSNPKVLKIFHAAKQDLEILVRLTGKVVTPVFDTQVAAALVGWGSQISFAKIVQKVMNKKIHKTETYTDWCRRPLSQNQIDYALDDARFLLPVYKRLIQVLKKMNRLDWTQGEFVNLENPKVYGIPDPRRQFLKIKNIRSLKRKNLAVMVELAAWREKEAIRRDCLPKAVVRDEPLLEIARILPKKLDDLGSIRGFHRKEVSKCGEAILNAIQKGLVLPDDQIPELPEYDGYSTSKGVEELLAAYVQIRSEELKIEPSVLAHRKQIHDFVKCYEQDKNLAEHFLLQGWRKECIGSKLSSILDGSQALVIGEKGKVKLISMNHK
ncbi:MAG: ribonuclease D [Nitrospinaceae bacterium]|nr:MAG: ribonuclease D [Nitrospinaceae bacterium]